MVLGITLIFLFILCLLLNNILSPLNINWKGNGEVSTFSFSLCINTKPMLLTDDSIWPGPNHILVLTGYVCCAWLACCLIVLYCVILPNFYAIVHPIMDSMGFPSFSFPFLEDQLCLTSASVMVPMDNGLGAQLLLLVSWQKFPLITLIHFLIWHHRYTFEDMVELHMCFKFCMMSLSVFVSHMILYCPLWSPLLGLLLHHAFTASIFSLDCYCSSSNKDRSIIGHRLCHTLPVAGQKPGLHLSPGIRASIHHRP